MTDGEWSVITPINFSLKAAGGTGAPPVPVLDDRPALLGVQYDFGAVYVGLQLPNITVAGDGFTLYVTITVDDRTPKRWHSTLPVYARGNMHLIVIFQAGTAWKHHDFFLGNTTQGWAYWTIDAVALAHGEVFNYALEGVPLGLGNCTLETNFVFWENTGDVRYLHRTSPYGLHLDLYEHFYNESTGEYFDTDYCWPPTSTMLPPPDTGFPDAIFDNWSVIPCPGLTPIPWWVTELLPLVMLSALAGAVVVVGALRAVRYLRGRWGAKRRRVEYWRGRPRRA